MAQQSDSPEFAPQPVAQCSFIEETLQSLIPQAQSSRARSALRNDQLAQYLSEPPVGDLGLLEYWRIRERQWPQLAKMAYDMMSIPAMSSECERVFSSVSRRATKDTTRLTGRMLSTQECVKNWKGRGAIDIATAYGVAKMVYTDC